MRALKSELRPIDAEDDTAQGARESNQDDESAAHPGTRTASTEPEPLLQPVEQRSQQEQFQQPTQAALPIIHRLSPSSNRHHLRRRSPDCGRLRSPTPAQPTPHL